MAVQINIRDVPKKVRDELALQVRRRKQATQTRISAAQILENRKADRR
jgi:hypothetical protein